MLAYSSRASLGTLTMSTSGTGSREPVVALVLSGIHTTAAIGNGAGEVYLAVNPYGKRRQKTSTFLGAILAVPAFWDSIDLIAVKRPMTEAPFYVRTVAYYSRDCCLGKEIS